MSPSDETPLETTIDYEQLAIGLTATLAMREPDPYVKAAMDFALLEDFDHLYRYANLLDMDEDVPAHKLTLDMVEITPGRPTIAEHRHPCDTVFRPGEASRMDIQTILGAMTLTAGEQQTMNFYMNVGNTLPEGYPRDLYQEIAMVEEEHVTQYGELIGDGEFPEPLELAPTKEYVREVLAAEVCRTTQCEEFADVSELDEDNRFFMWNNHVNGSVDEVPSHVVIAERITKEGEDYRREDEPNPVEQLQDRSCDNTTISRTAG